MLSRVPRQMLLIFKTNDLLRGIEFSLNTHKRSVILSLSLSVSVSVCLSLSHTLRHLFPSYSMSSFITMSRCCVHSLFAHHRTLCDGSRWCKAKVGLSETWAQLRISLYALYLYLLQSGVVKYWFQITGRGAAQT